MVWQRSFNLVILSAFALLVVCGPATANDANLIAHWTFDEGSGTIAYDSAGDNDGTLNGDTTWTTGQIDGALSFDGDGDYVESDSSIADLPMGDHTVCLWVKKDNLDSEGIIGAGDAVQWWLLSYGSQYSAYTAQWDDDVNKKYVYMDGPAIVGVWTHLVMRRDGSEYSLFADGVKQADTETVNNNFQVEENIRIGIAQWNPEGVTGSLDDVRIYNRALTDAEVEQLYWQGFGLSVAAIKDIEDALAEKLAALENIDAALENEWLAYDALEQMLISGEYEGLSKRDIAAAQRKVEAAIMRQERSKEVVLESIVQLEDALLSLGAEP